MDFKDAKCKATEVLIRKKLYEDHRELWDKFNSFLSFPNDYDSGARVLLFKDQIIPQAEKFEKIVKEIESEVRRII